MHNGCPPVRVPSRSFILAPLPPFRCACKGNTSLSILYAFNKLQIWKSMTDDFAAAYLFFSEHEDLQTPLRIATKVLLSLIADMSGLLSAYPGPEHLPAIPRISFSHTNTNLTRAWDIFLTVTMGDFAAMDPGAGEHFARPSCQSVPPHRKCTHLVKRITIGFLYRPATNTASFPRLILALPFQLSMYLISQAPPALPFSNTTPSHHHALLRHPRTCVCRSL